MKPKFAAILLVAATFTVAGCATPAREDRIVQNQESLRWQSFVAGYIEQTFRANPTFAVNQGRHEFDGMLPDWSPTGINSEVSRLKSAIAAAEAFDPRLLPESDRFERDYLVAQARGELFWLETAGSPWRNPAFYVGSLDPSPYVTRPYAAPAVRMRAFIKYLDAIPAAAAQVRRNLRKPMPLTFVDYGKAGFAGYAEYYPSDGKAAFASVRDPALQRELDSSAQAASAAMASLARWIDEQRPRATQDFALGPQRFAQMLRDTEMVDTPIAELEAIGRADLSRNQEALRLACADFAPGASIAACMAKLNANKPDGGPVAGARAQLAGLKQFLIEKDLVTIPGTEEARVEESPPYNRQNSAYIDIPGPYEAGLPSTYYISPPDPAWSKEVQAAYIPGEADLLFTSVHEVWPGHFLNFLHANRSRSTFGKVFVGYAFAEGWAHYSEEMMWEAGLGSGDPEIHVGQLSNALLRDCRLLSAIGLHSGTMTVDQSRRLFREQCHQDEGNARQQSARGTYDPAYLNYTMGKLMIMKLREDWVARRGGRRAWKAFHDRFLGYGGPPIPLVRAQMMGEAPRAVF